jgi:leader peptidase (prepilin peptidase) / N-methyltransferase
METATRAVFFALFGLAFGSFVTVLVHRTPRHETVVTGRSRCPSCGATITARDNLPVVSYLLLRGRCRSCGVRISPLYPLTELATAALFVAASVAFADPFVAAMMAVFLGMLLAVALTDLQERLIPNAVVYPGLVVFTAGLALAAFLHRDVNLAAGVEGFLVFGGSLFLVALIVPRGMGMGDVKLAALIGLVVGSRGLPSVMVAVALGILLGGVGAMLALAAGRSRKSAMPFGPFLAGGAAAATFAGPWLAHAYLGIAH